MIIHNSNTVYQSIIRRNGPLKILQNKIHSYQQQCIILSLQTLHSQSNRNALRIRRLFRIYCIVIQYFVLFYRLNVVK